MRIKRLISFILILLPAISMAGNYVSGYIRTSHTTNMDFQADISIYLDTLVVSHEIILDWGDGYSDTLSATGTQLDTTGYYLYEYSSPHSYGANGTYKLVVEETFRIGQIMNLPMAENEYFHIETEIEIDGLIGANSQGVILAPMVDLVQIGQVYIYAPNINDPEGDSLAFSLIYPQGNSGPFFSYTDVPDVVGCEPSIGYGQSIATGNIEWNTPVCFGKYLVTLQVEEWRSGIRISITKADLILDVVNSVSVEEIAKSRSLHIYPNPCAGFLLNPKMRLLEIYSLSGHHIKTTNKAYIDLSQLESGIYMLRSGGVVKKIVLTK